MEIIPFSYNWNNKLNNQAFTTIRLRNDRKYKIGQTIDVVLNSERQRIDKGLHTIADIKHFKIAKLNNFISYLDMGYDVKECTRILTTMYKNFTPPINWETQELSLILLVKEKK